MDKAQKVMEECKYQTEIKSKDGEPMVLFHDKPISPAEKSVFEELTAKELEFVLKLQGFEEHKL